METPQIVIFGASGDLARRKLFPALLRLADAHSFEVLGVARGEKSEESFRKELAEALPAELGDAFEGLARRIHYRRADVADRGSLEALAGELDGPGRARGTGRLFYLAVAPELFAETVTGLDAAGLLAVDESAPRAWRRVVVEKPFGRDRESARILNRELHRVLREEQIYRIDHYLGKETVQNLIAFRFHNAIFEPLWNRHHVELVQISVAEDIGVGARGGYYDRAGALRDVIQNHMLQLLALTAMEAPASLEPEAIREQKEALLRGLRLPDPEEVRAHCVRARYRRGRLGGAPVSGYLEEEDVAPDSRTETYVALRAGIDNWRWSGVPFLLRHGKRLPRRFTEIVVQFRTAPLQLFERPAELTPSEFRRRLRAGSLCEIRPNRLHLCLQPQEGIRLCFGVKEPGGEMRMSPATLAFDYREHFGKAPPSAYERLLVDALRGDPTLFLRADEIETAWEFVDAIRDGWETAGPRLVEYEAGSWGPSEAEALFEGCEGGWSQGD